METCKPDHFVVSTHLVLETCNGSPERECQDGDQAGKSFVSWEYKPGHDNPSPGRVAAATTLLHRDYHSSLLCTLVRILHLRA
jgi:hypothetical protein